jgi:hypothetical protein
VSKGNTSWGAGALLCRFASTAALAHVTTKPFPQLMKWIGRMEWSQVATPDRRLPLHFARALSYRHVVECFTPAHLPGHVPAFTVLTYVILAVH